MLSIFFGCALTARAADDLSDSKAAVEAGRDALAGRWNAPWYDKSADDLKPIVIPKPSKPWGIGKWLEGTITNFDLELGELLHFLVWLLIAGVLVWIVIALIRSSLQAEMRLAAGGAKSEATRAAIERVEALPLTLDQPVDDFLVEARRRSEQGDLLIAMVYLFSFELIELDKAGWIRLVKGKTNRQYLRELHRHEEESPRLGSIFERTTRIFEAAFFGAHVPSPQMFETCWREANEFRSLLAEDGKDAA